MGQVMIVGGALLAFLYGVPGGIWLALIGWFLVAAATAEARYAELGAMLEGLVVRDAMVHEPVTAPAAMTLDRFIADLHARHRYASYPVIAGDGSLAGLVTFTAAAAVAPERRAGTTVADVALPPERAAVVDADDPLGEAAFTLTAAPAGRALVTGDGEPGGLLSITDVSRLLQLRQAEARPAGDRRQAPPVAA